MASVSHDRENVVTHNATGHAFEDEHVHQVYEQIASHFSSTRYKPWPIIERFLKELPAGSIGLDIGCGNGKYLPVNRDVFIIGSDRSESLVKFALQHSPHSVVVSDILSLPHPHNFFDFAISIAVVHHLSTKERRIAAIQAILDTLRPQNGTNQASSSRDGAHNSKEGGKALIYVWALEQKTSRRGWDENDEQDVMVPWVTKNQNQTTSPKPEIRRATPSDQNIISLETEVDGTSTDAVSLPIHNQDRILGPPKSRNEETKTFYRFYHLYRSGELEDDVTKAGGAIVESGYEKDNWWAIVMRPKD